MVNIFLFFVLGFLSCQYIIPILDSITSTILGLFEILRAKISLSVVKVNDEIEKIQNNSSGPKQPLGFAVPTDFTEEDYENTEDEFE